MLAGLLFASTESVDRPETLSATLPIGGVTLIEFQARLLIAAGASQIVVVVGRLTPELLGAINRIGRRGVAIDTVRTPSEALAKLHPLARIVWLADGLVTSGAIVEMLRDRDHDTVLTMPGGDLERISPNAVWAGAATIDAQRIAEVTRLPADYDFASALLRVTVQRGADQIPLPDSAVREGHGVQRDSRALEAKGRAAMIGALTARGNWVDRYLVAGLARATLPLMAARGIPAIGLVSGGILVALGGLIATFKGLPVLGLIAEVVAIAGFSLGEVLGWLRDQRVLGRALAWIVPGSVVLSVLAFGQRASVDAQADTAMLIAVMLVAAGALAERAAGATRRRTWWAVPAAYPLILVPFAILAQPVAGLALSTLYAGATLSAAIERLRGYAGRDPARPSAG